MKLSTAASHLSKVILFTLLFFHFNQAKAQFSYAGFNLGYTWENLEKGNNILNGNENYSRINELTATFSFMNRPIRRVGIGASISVPVIKGFTWSFDGAPTTGDNSYSELDNDFGAQSPSYDPFEYDYNVQNRLGITLIGRLYFSDESSWYFDLRYTLSSVNESFIFKRAASGGVPARNIDYNENHSARGPGFELGGLAQFDDHFFLNYGFIMDFISYDTSPFEYNIEFASSFSGDDSEVKIQSRIQESAFMFQFYYGIGYRF